MMKKILLGLMIVFVAALLIGCGAKESKTTVKKVDKTKVSEPEGEVYEVPAVGEDDEETGTIELEINESEEADEPVEEVEPEENHTIDEGVPSPKDLGVTQEELDELKAGIEGMDAEDLGGLSE